MSAVESRPAPPAKQQQPPRPAPPRPQLPRAVQFIDIAIEIVLYGLLIFLPAAYGTVDAWSECIALWMGGAIAVALAIRMFFAPARFDRVAGAIVAAYLVIAGLALIPLPRSIVQSLSPATVATRTQLLGDLPDAPQALATMPISFFSWATAHDLRVVLLAVTVLAAVMIVFRDAARLRRLLLAISLIGLTAACLALAQDLTGTHEIYWHATLGDHPARSGSFVNHSHFSQFMNLSLGAALGLMLTSFVSRGQRSWARITLSAAAIILGLLTIALSLSRGGVIAMIVAGGFTLLILLSRKSLRGSAGVVITLAALALVVLGSLGFERFAQRMSHLDMFGRLQMVHDTRAIIDRFPLTGIGLGTFEWVYPAYNHTNAVGTASHLENEYVQSAAEMGIPGLLLVLAFAAWVWRRYVGAVRAGEVAVIGLGYGLLAVMIHSLSDYGQHLPSIACLSAATCGMILNLGRRDQPEEIRRHSIAFAMIGLPIVLLVVFWSIRGAERARRGEMYWNQANALGDDRSPVYGELLGWAVSADPGNVHDRYWSAVYQWRTSQRTAGDANRIIPMLNAARKLCPTYAPLYAVLGQIEYGTLKQPLGVEHLHTAATLDLSDQTIGFLAGRVDAERGDFDSAVPELRRAVDLDNTVMHDVNDLALKKLHKPELAVRVAGDSCYLLTLAANAMFETQEYQGLGHVTLNRMIDLLQRSAEQPGADPAIWWDVAGRRAEQHRYADAEWAINRALQSDPTRAEWRIRHAEILARMGRAAEAIQEAREIVQSNPNNAAGRQLLDQLTKPNSG